MICGQSLLIRRYGVTVNSVNGFTELAPVLYKHRECI